MVKYLCYGHCSPTGELITEPDQDGYRYLGILELDNIPNKEMKFKTSYFKRLQLLLGSKQNLSLAMGWSGCHV